MATGLTSKILGAMQGLLWAIPSVGDYNRIPCIYIYIILNYVTLCYIIIYSVYWKGL
jgi:hypothetical protein